MGEPTRPTHARRRPTGGEGEPEVFCVDEQTDHPIDLGRWRTLAEGVLRTEGISGACELSVMFVDRDAIADLNRDFLDGAGPTDVLAFPIDLPELDLGAEPTGGTRGPGRAPVDPGEFTLLLGDVVLCPAVAAEQAPGHAGTFDDELALLVVHGVLHVLGWDHESDVERTKMQQRERALLESLHWQGAAPAGFRQDHDGPAANGEI